MHVNSQIILKPNNSSLFDRCLKTVTLKVSIWGSGGGLVKYQGPQAPGQPIL
jgi:hypothetical protein